MDLDRRHALVSIHIHMPRQPKESSDDKIPLMVRLPPDVMEEAKRNAVADDRTVNSYIVKAVREANAREKRKGSR